MQQTDLANRYAQVRAQTLALAEPLSEADCQAQSMPDASPTKWHLAHVTWFFETFVLEVYEPQFQPHHPAFRVLFNSYYQGVGDQHPRPQRGLITRPDLAAVRDYRAAVDRRMQALLRAVPVDAARDTLIELGLQHEQQHQELLLTDVLHLLSCNPLSPAYRQHAAPVPTPHVPLQAVSFEGGLVQIGHDGNGFAFDNEGPRHQAWLQPYALANRLVTEGEWAEFVDGGGYGDARWWLSAGWDWLRAQRIAGPLHARRDETGQRWRTTLDGLQPANPEAPVCHVSLYEADAYAHWRAARDGLPWRLPTESEWEHAAAMQGAAAIDQGSFVDSAHLQPTAAHPARQGLQQLFGEVWQWTNSAYLAYPGYAPWAGAVGEYNGKFMMNQMVLRGGSCATPRSHIRASYRNFFPPDARWQFSGVRLARGL